MAAHPRVCGENGRRDVLIHADPGSSPRVRGKPPTRPCARPRGGLIPACAGKTSSSPRAPSRAWAHPRVCGENFLAYFQEMRPDGSSPRVRGKLEHCLQAVHRFGLIPACAGKTAPRWSRWRRWRAHPRVCGENDFDAWLDTVVDGSSPRVRGKRPRNSDEAVRPRLIPACAGKTWSWGGGHGVGWAHPRVCGENLVLGPSGRPGAAHPRVCGENRDEPQLIQCDLGSSPRVRGKRAAGGTHFARTRLIPACAGKTLTGCGRSPPTAAHPRVCGENLYLDYVTFLNPGSSPRVRGKHGRRRPVVAADGLIPACAGKTRGREPRAVRHPAHPRVCGENPVLSRKSPVYKGSSPRVRGKQPRTRPWSR